MSAEQTKTELEMPVEPVKITISGIITDLENGLTRTKDDANYNPEIGSIQEKYNISVNDVKTLFQHSKLKGLRVKPVKKPGFELIDDTETTEEKPSAEKYFGQPSEATLKEMAKAEATKSADVKTESVDLPF